MAKFCLAGMGCCRHIVIPGRLFASMRERPWQPGVQQREKPRHSRCKQAGCLGPRPAFRVRGISENPPARGPSSNEAR
eukprot:5442077-Pleurochrysis_carterae.AAC.4